MAQPKTDFPWPRLGDTAGPAMVVRPLSGPEVSRDSPKSRSKLRAAAATNSRLSRAAFTARRTVVTFDVAVVGLGVMGSSSARALAIRGARVVAFDQFAPPHTMGSSHGQSRIIREAYYEHPLYVPLVQRAYELWNELERETDSQLLLRTGGLMGGAETGTLVRGALKSARTHGIAHEILDATAVEQRFPAYRPSRAWIAVFERRAGMLFPERCIEAAMHSARQHGATLHLNTRVTSWKANGRTVTVQTSNGSYDAKQLVVAAGSWLPGLSDYVGMTIPLEIERQLSHWFEPTQPNDSRYRAASCPVALWDAGDDVFATLPDVGAGVKCGMHHAGVPTSPEDVDRVVSPAENEAARGLLNDIMPGAGGRLLDSRVCLYTNTPDRHFIVDWAVLGRVLIVSPCSGHGFKFATAIGEVVSQLILDGRSWLDLKPFSLDRFK